MKTDMIKNIFLIDLFAFKPSLNFNNKAYHKSGFGVVATYFYIIVFTLVVISFSRELISRDNPSVIVSESKYSYSNPPSIDISKNSLKVAFTIYEGDKVIPYDRSYFKFSGKQVVVKSKNSFGKFQFIEQGFELKNCSKENVPRESNSTSNLVGEEEQTFLCIDMKFNEMISNQDFNRTEREEKGFYIKGFFGTDEYTQIYIGFSKCVNDTSGNPASPVCKSNEEIERKINGIYITGTILNKFVELQDYSNPFKYNVEWFYVKVNSQLNKEMQLFFQKSHLKTDDSWLLSSERVEDYVTYSKKVEIIENNIRAKHDNFAAFSFQIDSVEKSYIRRYKKIQDLAAEVSGIMKLLLLIMTIFMRPLVERSFKIAFVESIFNFKSLPIGKPTDKNPGGRSKFFKILKKICWRDSKYSQEKYSRAFKTIEEKIDLKNLFNKIIEIERLLYIIFEKYQYILFKKYCCNNRWVEFVDLQASTYISREKLYSISSDLLFSCDPKSFTSSLCELRLKTKAGLLTIDKNLNEIFKFENFDEIQRECLSEDTPRRGKIVDFQVGRKIFEGRAAQSNEMADLKGRSNDG